jgi:phenylacetate-CoA ligase
VSDVEDRLLTAFRTAALNVPAYQVLLAEHGVNAGAVTDLQAFLRLVPVTSKANTFERFGIHELSTPGHVADVADVLTSSGRGGRFSFGLTTRAQAAATVEFLDAALDEAFQVKSQTTLAINCLPMGVVFSSNVMTLATTSVREDMAVALVQTFGDAYDQVMLVGDPLFLKRLTDHAREAEVDWSRYRVNAIVGEEIFGESYRRYLSTSLGLDGDRPERGYVMSSFGIGELGLHLGYETPSTVAVRRAAHQDPAFARELFGAAVAAGAPLPMLFAFNPLRMYPEILHADADGYGALTISMLDVSRRIPMLRYQAGDIAAVLDADHVAALAAARKIRLPAPLPRHLFALRGRASEALPNGGHVGTYKESLYARESVARCVTGAVRVIVTDRRCTMHVQLTRSARGSERLQEEVAESIPAAVRPTRVVLWPYARFPFGMTLDYERKFAYYVAGERDL